MSFIIILLTIILFILLIFVIRRSLIQQSKVIIGGGDRGGNRPQEKHNDKETCKRSCKIDNCLLKYYEKLRKVLEKSDKDNKNKTIIQMHITKWCPHCDKLRTIWEKIKKNPKFNKYVFLEKDQDEYNIVGITCVPTIIKYTPDHYLIKYKGRIDYDNLSKWIQK